MIDRTLAAVLLAAACLGGPVAAQEAPGAGALDVEEGYRVRLTTPSDTLLGSWLPPADTLLRIGTGAGVRTVSRGRVDGLWVRGTRARAGTLIGAAAGGVALGAFVGLLADALCEVDCEGAGDFAHGLAVGGAVGALGGGIFGGVVGSWILTWRPVWP